MFLKPLGCVRLGARQIPAGHAKKLERNFFLPQTKHGSVFRNVKVTEAFGCELCVEIRMKHVGIHGAKSHIPTDIKHLGNWIHSSQ
jgi:hypothetical protein